MITIHLIPLDFEAEPLVQLSVRSCLDVLAEESECAASKLGFLDSSRNADVAARNRFCWLIQSKVTNQSIYVKKYGELSSCRQPTIMDTSLLRYQCTPKLTILANFSYWYSQEHLIEFFQLQKVLQKKVSPRQSYNAKSILWINYLYLEAVNKLSWSIKVPLKVT